MIVIHGFFNEWPVFGPRGEKRSYRFARNARSDGDSTSDSFLAAVP